MTDKNEMVVGYKWPPLQKEAITLEQLVKYAGASGDFNPLHYEEAVSKKAGFEQLIAQGALIMGFVGQALTGWVDNKYLRMMKVRFVKPTYLGDSITVKGEVVEIKDNSKEKIVVSELVAMDQNGDKKITGMFEVSLPSE
jgi:acyl dehydratase